jgi:hypothetical protein
MTIVVQYPGAPTEPGSDSGPEFTYYFGSGTPASGIDESLVTIPTGSLRP